jgi:hypothetical protein
MSSITDKPISLKSEDLLNVEKYSNALSNFITENGDLILKPFLFKELGNEKYRDLLIDIASEIH